MGHLRPICSGFYMGRMVGAPYPQGATGDRHLLERLQALSEFDNRAFIEAMSSTSARRFLCWQKPA